MIQRITREMTSVDMFVDFNVERKVNMGLGVVLWRARRWSVQRGILVAATCTRQFQKTNYVETTTFERWLR